MLFEIILDNNTVVQTIQKNYYDAADIAIMLAKAENENIAVVFDEDSDSGYLNVFKNNKTSTIKIKNLE